MLQNDIKWGINGEAGDVQLNENMIWDARDS